ncbi:chromosome segregation protein SMC [Legionella hackeliae]|uniref:Chromosome partition protein Smc n=1 Tax=Legionella hackeliae TaxID=449 RepID=A0A0A8UYQ7_LEGHA|nr:chromosome segregation protein SMC [Legionella hackeliae]KTD12490.1 chromosome partition protein smc [Legionella hackeliae]CEK11904.1 Chromosome segregation SMC protein [10 coiled coil domains] [Legionella hackeliae]STX48674.1 chromosome partition protein smc [Legionella hackeliae]
MQLKELKLAGFKSFVDPTVVPFPSQLVAVVGPNGCGKSNVIDAVRWVMGESSAKNLRGESMTDVIFNGSTQRKAVGQASVELIFDNSLGRLAGQYGSYQEISVKRVVTRDGDSSYYLNGSRCRRRDITDIFLGTGAGARGYSIIGQGTISRIVEARPEELRAYLEEAAGVSKYKERRRETVLRINHTRENLARVADIRDELDKQLQRLERQAKAAERYKLLKAEERLYKAEILALKWQTLTEDQVTKQAVIKELMAEHEKHQANAADAYKQSTVLREKLQDDNEIFQQIQSNFYQLATDIARLEETIQQNQREKQRLQADQQQIQVDWQAATRQIEQDTEILQNSEKSLDLLFNNWQKLQTEFSEKQQLLQNVQQQQTSWNAKIQTIQTELNKALRETQVEQVRLQHIAEQRQQILTRLEKITEEQQLGEIDDLIEALKIQKDSFTTLETLMQHREHVYQQVSSELASCREQFLETETLVLEAQDNVHSLTTRHATLLATQQAALGRAQTVTPSHLWKNNPRLVEKLTVAKEWQYACELVLGEGLQAIVLDSLDELWPSLKEMPIQTAVFLTPEVDSPTRKTFPRLSEMITGLNPNWLLSLKSIYAATNLDEALSWLPHLQENESIITPSGYWLAKKWVKIAIPSEQEQGGLLGRQEELVTLNESLVVAQTHLSGLKEKRHQLHETLKTLEQHLEMAKQDLSKVRDDYKTCEGEIANKERTRQQIETRTSLLAIEKDELTGKLEELAIDKEKTESALLTATQTATRYEQEQKTVNTEKNVWEETLSSQRDDIDETRSLLHQSQLAYDREKIKIQQLTENVKREQLRLETLNDRMEALASRLMALDAPATELQERLEEKILRHNELETQLTVFREGLNVLTKELESFETLVRMEEKNAQLVQEKIQQEQMQEQALAVRATGIIESLTELDVQLKELLANIPADVSQALREQMLDEVIEKIKRLGAINLAAIEEYETESQRKQHLDEQYQDLSEALATLDAAIEKMDKETQQRFKNTFDEVNTAFQALFPRLFGGGRAMLELTCDNLLEAGILVMAQPPGKRNSTIHLLSGGEKAMTAVALVFAIFQLNPSPFCMLDEVDAPLDDVNVGRFCTLVKEMSQFVQFLFITHNKVTMELANHLIGVTMREPGVSRVVAVDVEQALSMSSS